MRAIAAGYSFSSLASRLISWTSTLGLRPLYTPRSFALELVLTAQVGLEFREDPEHVEKGLARGSAGVDRLLGRLERDTSALQFMDDVLEILHRLREVIDAGHHPRVALTKEGEEQLEFGPPFPASAGLLLGTEYRHTGGRQR